MCIAICMHRLICLSADFCSIQLVILGLGSCLAISGVYEPWTTLGLGGTYDGWMYWAGSGCKFKECNTGA